MAIILAYENVTDGQKEEVMDRVKPYKGEISQISIFPRSAQIVLNDSEISRERGQEVLDTLIEMLKAHKWGTDLPTRFPERIKPPDVYASRYKIKIPYDPSLK